MIRVPPGRSGRLWLRHRLTTATRATTLLAQKLRALGEEQRRLARHAQHTGEQWAEHAAEATTWGLRAALAGGERGLRLATTADLATVTITWTTSMGATYPTDATCQPPRRPAGLAVIGGAALARAEVAYRTALESGARHAVAIEALRVVEGEVATTRQRVRALDRRWIPQLRQAIADLELGLAEQERAEGLTRRRARNRTREGTP
jgi:V/A-type H+/Na+-transporting ATPase subunit D